MAVGGILFTAIIIANIRALAVESGSVKMSTRLLEKARCQAIESGRPAEGVFKIRGIFRKTTNAPTELERREREFGAMRAVQKAADQNHRLLTLALATTAFMVVSPTQLLGFQTGAENNVRSSGSWVLSSSGGKAFHSFGDKTANRRRNRGEHAEGGQDWTYFETMYFVFVAQLTIGYGDFHPQTNIAKPVFVLWALIALPTMTILVSAIGDFVS
jgi:potassium channel subfamily K, other eukaryote